MRVLWITAFTLVVDQLSKAAVLASMYRGESIPIWGDWLRLTFTENPGMAFGIEVGPKGTVTVLALVATLLIVAYLLQVRRGYWPYRASLALVLGGALGNIIDRTLYGVLLGYGDLFEGKVVDFIHVDVWRGFLPDAWPLVGGTYLPLFPIWNVADMAIVGGVIGVLLFHHTYYMRWMEEQAPTPEDPIVADATASARDADPAGPAPHDLATEPATEPATGPAGDPPTEPTAEPAGDGLGPWDDDLAPEEDAPERGSAS